jgi:molybdenum-dependent DNA-binding transcriptional regulator ModE
MRPDVSLLLGMQSGSIRKICKTAGFNVRSAVSSLDRVSGQQQVNGKTGRSGARLVPVLNAVSGRGSFDAHPTARFVKLLPTQLV